MSALLNSLMQTAEVVLPDPLLVPLKTFKQRLDYRVWLRNGQPAPPPHRVKQLVIEEYQAAYQIRTLVETGTFRGDMIMAQLPYFQQIVSIEVAEGLYRQAVKRFSGKPQVRLIQGDSGQVLKSLVPTLAQPALFWLDGHYSGGDTSFGETHCPVYQELDAILASPVSHLILIDDARLFDGTNDYPTLAALENHIRADGRYHLTVKDDVIRLISRQ
jgi:hypothetical protein